MILLSMSGGAGLKTDAAAISAWLRAGGKVLAIPLDEQEAGARDSPTARGCRLRDDYSDAVPPA
jgi:cellulose biosynthesis protein BcsQ